MKEPLVSISGPPKSQQTADLLVKLHWNPEIKARFPFKTFASFNETIAAVKPFGSHFLKPRHVLLKNDENDKGF